MADESKKLNESTRTVADHFYNSIDLLLPGYKSFVLDPAKKVYQKTERPEPTKKRQQLTYSGCDIIPIISGIDANGNVKPIVIGDIATLTYSAHQDKMAVRTLGRTMPRGFTRGPETVAGSIIFSVFDRQSLWELSNKNRDYRGETQTLSHLPAFDILLSFVNEEGTTSKLVIFGAQIIDEGQTMSVEDTYIENTAQYIAYRVVPLEPLPDGGTVPIIGIFNSGRATTQQLTATNKQAKYDYTYNIAP